MSRTAIAFCAFAFAVGLLNQFCLAGASHGGSFLDKLTDPRASAREYEVGWVSLTFSVSVYAAFEFWRHFFAQFIS